MFSSGEIFLYQATDKTIPIVLERRTLFLSHRHIYFLLPWRFILPWLSWGEIFCPFFSRSAQISKPMPRKVSLCNLIPPNSLCCLILRNVAIICIILLSETQIWNVGRCSHVFNIQEPWMKYRDRSGRKTFQTKARHHLALPHSG